MKATEWLNRLIELAIRPATLAWELGRRARYAPAATPDRTGVRRHEGRREDPTEGHRHPARVRAIDLARSRAHGVTNMPRRSPAGKPPRRSAG